MKAKDFICHGVVLTFIFFTSLGLVGTGNSTGPAVDHSIYSALLKKHVKNGHVNYQGFKSHEARLDQYLKVLENTDMNILFPGEPRFTDTHTIRLNGNTYSAKNWVIATGSSPVVYPIEGLDRTPYITNWEIFYLDHLSKTMIIFGGGPIGSEMGQAFNRFGTKVTIVDRAGQILGKEDKDMADAVMKVMKQEGVEFKLNSAIESVKDLGSNKEVIIRDRHGKTLSLKAEQILVAMGRGANTDGLGLEYIGVEFERSGIKVDSRMRTTRKHINAAGDVAGGYQFTHTAGYEGGIVI